MCILGLNTTFIRKLSSGKLKMHMYCKTMFVPYKIVQSRINLQFRYTPLGNTFITSLIKMRYVNIQFDLIFAISSWRVANNSHPQCYPDSLRIVNFRLSVRDRTWRVPVAGGGGGGGEKLTCGVCESSHEIETAANRRRLPGLN